MTTPTAIPTDTRFKLSAPIDTVPTGATGQLTRLDIFHVTLAFDEYPDLVFDVYDTDPEVWDSISPTVNPSMTDPPRRRMYFLVGAGAVTAFIVWGIIGAAMVAFWGNIG